MTNIDYKAEVLAIYDDAIIMHALFGYMYVYTKKADTFIIGNGCPTENEAWQSAYENLKKEGRIL
jgi:hypothetical protein